MSLYNRRFAWVGLSIWMFAVRSAIGGGVAPRPDAIPEETLHLPDGEAVVGRLVGGSVPGFRFEVPGKSTALSLEAGSTITLETPPAKGVDRPAPFRVELGMGRRISGRLGRIDAATVELIETSAGNRVRIPRGAVRSVIQRQGEMQIMDEGFEALNGSRWTLIGDPTIVDGPRSSGEHSLRLPAAGSSLTHRLPDPIGAGRLEVAFFDDGVLSAGQQWFVDLLFRGPAGMETIRAVLGWSEESLSVESPGGPALAVQRLLRKPGWHRLVIEFHRKEAEISVDGNDLAHGKGPGGPLIEVRLASYRTPGAGEAPHGLAGHLDDLRLVRFAEPATGHESDPSFDVAGLTGGDQLFGTISDADGEHVRMKVDDSDLDLPWSEVSGIDLRRSPVAGEAIDGLLVRVRWGGAAGDDSRDLDVIEGALVELSDATLGLETSYAGRLTLRRDQVRDLHVLGRARRIVLDSTPHHLGDEIVGAPFPLDPPQPEGASLTCPFDLVAIPEGPAWLTIDAVQVAGEAAGLEFARDVKEGKIRSEVRLNGRPVDYLNRHVTTRNLSPERIRLALPAGLLTVGKNTLVLHQVGPADDSGLLDDIGVLEIGLEFAATPSKPIGPREE